MSTRYRRRPTPVLAVQWTGDNETELRKFAGFRFTIIGDNEQLEVDNIDATARLLETPAANGRPSNPATG